jgi:hypothetical protein
VPVPHKGFRQGSNLRDDASLHPEKWSVNSKNDG